MKKRLFGILVSFLVGLMPNAVGQNYEDAFNDFVRQNEQSFNRFADSINRQFAAALAANIKSFMGETPVVKDANPKPVRQPQYPNGDTPQKKITPPCPERDPERAPGNAPEANSEPEEVQSPIETPLPNNLKSLSFTIFGEDARIAVRPFQAELKGISAKDVSDFWLQLSECDYVQLLQYCQESQKTLAYNDWAIFQLVLRIAQQIYPSQYNEQTVLTVFLLNQLGLEAKVGFEESHLFVLVAIQQQVYGVSFCDISGLRYYIEDFNPAYHSNNKSFSFRTYDLNFPQKTKNLDMNLKRPIKTHSVNDREIKDSIINISMNMVQLFSTYPQVDVDVYANAIPSEEFCASLDRLLVPVFKDLSEYDAVALLLKYLQYGFDYATDDEQFGFEKPFFCEENYFYPQNDCEDRAVLFSFLVRYLLGMDVVLIDYPGHLATAVCFKENVSGASLLHRGKRFVICDPTYVGAPIGVEMPEFTQDDRNVIPLKRIR